MRGKDVPEEVIERLRFLVRSYNDITRVSVSTQNRLHQMIDAPEKGYDRFVADMDSLKGKLNREMEKVLTFWDVWAMWLRDLPGCGPWIAGSLILAYYYKFVPICSECGEDLVKVQTDEGGKFTCPACGKDSKGEGNLIHRVGVRTWRSISAWQKYCGRFCDETGKMAKRRKGQQSNWSTRLRTVTYHFSEVINKQKKGNLYRDHLDRIKEIRAAKHPEAKKGHIHNMGKHETARLFLSHFMQVACEIEGMEVPSPWVIAHGGHTHELKPFYWMPMSVW
jgi:hypothetical protein